MQVSKAAALFALVALLGGAHAGEEECVHADENCAAGGLALLAYNRGAMAKNKGATAKNEGATGGPASLLEELAATDAVEEHLRAEESLGSRDNTPAGPMTTPLFPIPFDTSAYTGVINASSTHRGRKTGAVAFYRADAKKIYLGLAATGYVGFGMNWKGPNMNGADMVVCREWEPGAVTARDFFATGHEAPHTDPRQDWTIIRGGRSSRLGLDVTWCEVSRPRTTREKKKDLQLKFLSRSMHGLLAWSHPAAKNDQLAYHGYYNRWAKPIHFRLGSGEGDGVGEAVGEAVGNGVGEAVGDGVGESPGKGDGKGKVKADD